MILNNQKRLTSQFDYLVCMLAFVNKSFDNFDYHPSFSRFDDNMFTLLMSTEDGILRHESMTLKVVND
jgi:hypothetical protein